MHISKSNIFINKISEKMIFSLVKNIKLLDDFYFYVPSLKWHIGLGLFVRASVRGSHFAYGQERLETGS